MNYGERTCRERQASNLVRETVQSLSDKGVEFCLPFYVDVHGIPKTFSVPIQYFERMMRGEYLFGDSLEDDAENVVSLMLDHEAIFQIPWRPNVALVPGQLCCRSWREPKCSRAVLVSQVQRAAKLGLRITAGIKCEAYVVRDAVQNSGVSAFSMDGRFTGVTFGNSRAGIKFAQDLVAALAKLENLEFLHDVRASMEKLNWGLSNFDFDEGGGQFKFDLSCADALVMADRFVAWRIMTKEIARKHGFKITMMPRPYEDSVSSGAKFKICLADELPKNGYLSAVSDVENCASRRILPFYMGLKYHAPAIVALTLPTVNSYKNLPDMTLGDSSDGYSRSQLFRIVPPASSTLNDAKGAPSEAEEFATCFECVAVDSTANPYLVAAMMLGAGLDGIENQMDVREYRDQHQYSDQLPKILLEAITAFGADDLGRRVMGQDLYESYISVKTSEWWGYHNTISDWELERYLSKF